MNDTPATGKSASVVGSAPAEAIASLRANPDFPRALRMSAAGLASLYRGSRLVNMLMDDKARLLFGYFALVLHFSAEPADPGSGLTQSRMKELCREFGICSAGRVEVMLSLMRYAGYLASAPDPRDRRFSRLVATPKLVELLRQRWRVHFAAMAPMLPEAEAALAAIGDDDFVAAMLKAMMARFRAGNRSIDVLSARSTPALELFGHRSGGMMVLASLLGQAEGDDVTISVSGLARSFGVSRTHVLKLLADAEAEGLVRVTRRGSERSIRILLPLVEATQNLFAAVYVLLADSAREALAVIGRPQSGDAASP
jgi:DNA-binding MarR family transcriptional regulator